MTGAPDLGGVIGGHVAGHLASDESVFTSIASVGLGVICGMMALGLMRAAMRVAWDELCRPDDMDRGRCR